MNNNRYIISFFAAAIILVCALVGYGIYINTASNAHVKKLSAAHYATVHTVKTIYREITPTIYLTSLHLTSSKILDIHIKLDGTLSAVHVRPGDRVQKGQLIAEMTNDELPAQLLQIEASISSARANYIRWDNAANRNQLLAKAGAVSLAQMEESIANRDAAAAEIASSQAQRDQLTSRLENQKILAPQDGHVLKVYYAQGVYLGVGQAVIMIGDFSSLLTQLNMPSNQLEKLLLTESDEIKLFIPNEQSIQKISAAHFKTLDIHFDSNFDLILSKIEPPLGELSKYRSVTWQIDNKSAILEPGTYYHVKFYGVKPRLALAVPKEALLDKKDSSVFVVIDEHLEQRQIKTGVEDDYFIESLEGLKENDVVVVSGKEGLATGLRVHVAN